MPGICSRCFRNVYFAEEKRALGKVWHDRCFSCRKCGKTLNSRSITTYDDDLYCQKCCPKVKSIQPSYWQAQRGTSMYYYCSNDHPERDIWMSKSAGEINSEKGSEYGENSSCQYSVSSPDEVAMPCHKLDLDRSFAEFHNESDSSGKTPKGLLERSTPCRVSFRQEDLQTMIGSIKNEDLKNAGGEGEDLTEETRLRGGSGCRCSSNSSNSESSIRRGCCWKPGTNYKQQHSCKVRDCSGNLPRSTGNSQGCGNGGPCGGGCRGSCGTPGQACLPMKSCSSTLESCRRTNFAATSASFRCHGRRNGFDARQKSCDVDWKDSPAGCECLGGGADCQRCGLKVYQAEMQIASGVPYHHICFSCYCCRKPLETLTYHENCGEIYCKQCYIRNFGPQGYGYSGVLQTPM